VTASADKAADLGLVSKAAPDKPVTGVGPVIARAAAGPAWMRLLPAVVAACVMATGITVPSYWRDESATIEAVKRPVGALLHMLTNVDAVHGAYYLLMWPIAHIFGTSELVMRLPSLIAMSLAAGVVTATGRRLMSPGAGLAAGLIFAVIPSISLYGQMARSYALVVLVASTATYAFVRVLEDDTNRTAWLWYTASLTVLGILNVFALLLIPAHGVTMLVRYRARGAGPGGRPALRRWLTAALFAGIVNGPLIAAAYLQRGQLSWVIPAGLKSVNTAAALLGPAWMCFLILVLAVLGMLASTARFLLPWLDRAESGDNGWHGGVAAVCLPWLALPAILLLGVSVAITPVYTPRYLLFCIPAAALLAGAGVSALARIPGLRIVGPATATAAVVLTALLGLSWQQVYRQPNGHGDDIRQADQMIAASWKPGDAVFYYRVDSMSFGVAYPTGLGQLRDIQIAQQPIPSGTISGTTVSNAELASRLRHVSRIWVVQIDAPEPQPGELMRRAHLHIVWTWATSDIWLQLYARGAASSAP
jgi:mannosyltransferase